MVVEQADGEPISKSNTKMLTGVLSGNSETRRLSKIYNNTLPNSLRGSNSQNSGGFNSGTTSRLNSVVGLANLNTKDMPSTNGSNLNSAVSSNNGINGNQFNGTGFTNTNDSNENIVYPIKLRDLSSGTARKSYYIYTQTEEERKTWVNKILFAKREYASTAFALNAEPFKVRIVEDRFFGYDPADAPKLPIYAQATALDRGIKEYESMNGPVGVIATATLGVNGTIGNNTTSNLVSSLGLQTVQSNGSGSSYNTSSNSDTSGTVTKTSMAMIKAQALSKINCVVTCNVGGRFFLVTGLENGIYACDMTMRRMSASDAIEKLTKGSKSKRGRSKQTKTSPEKLPVKLPYNPYTNDSLYTKSLPNEGCDDEYVDDNDNDDDDDMATWAAPQWVRCLDLAKVTQLEILTEYNVLLVLAEKTLVWYHLDQILSIVQNQNRKPRDPALTGYAISRSREVSFFATGYMTTGLLSNSTSTVPSSSTDLRSHGYLNLDEQKCRELLFYRKKDVKETLKRSTTIEVVEPVKEKGSQKRRSQFILSPPALTKKSISRNHYGFSSTAGFHHNKQHTTHQYNRKHGADNASTKRIDAVSNYSVKSSKVNNGMSSKKISKVPEDLLCASIKSKINVGTTSTEYFRNYDNVTLPSDSLGITLFSSTFFIHTSRGFELLALSYKHPRIVPDPASIAPALHRGGVIVGTGLSTSHESSTTSTVNPTRSFNNPNNSNGGNHNVMSCASAIEAFKRKLEGSKPVGAFMLSDNTILLVYDQVAIFVDKFGNMSLPIVINMLAKVKYAVVSYPYLVAVSDELVEIRRLDLDVKKIISANNTSTNLVSGSTSMDSTQTYTTKTPLQPVNGNIGQPGTKKASKMTSRFAKKNPNEAVGYNNPNSIETLTSTNSATRHAHRNKTTTDNISPLVSPPRLTSMSSTPSTIISSNSVCPLKQVITGKHIRLVVANTRRSTKTGQEIMIAMAHPKYPGRQVLFELVKSEFVCDDESSSLAGL